MSTDRTSTSVFRGQSDTNSLQHVRWHEYWLGDGTWAGNLYTYTYISTATVFHGPDCPRGQLTMGYGEGQRAVPFGGTTSGGGGSVVMEYQAVFILLKPKTLGITRKSEPKMILRSENPGQHVVFIESRKTSVLKKLLLDGRGHCTARLYPEPFFCIVDGSASVLVGS
jgi:hypothetical protein